MIDLINEHEMEIAKELVWLRRLIQTRHNTRKSGIHRNYDLYDFNKPPNDEDIASEFMMYYGLKQILTIFDLQIEIKKQLIKLYNMGWTPQPYSPLVINDKIVWGW